MTRGAVLIVAAVALAGCADPGQRPASGFVASPGTETQTPTPEDTPTPQDALCGAWSADGSELAKAQGEIRNCFRYGQEWIVFTLSPDETSYGYVGIDACADEDQSCLDGSQPHPLADWSWTQAPYPGGLALLGSSDALSPPAELIVGNGGHELNFDPITDTFSDRTTAATETPAG
jgi:hypothetical protein